MANSARFNREGSNALLTQLGLPVVNPDNPMALTKTSYAGAWDLVDNDATQGALLVRISSDGSTTCTPSIPVNSAALACDLTFTNVANGNFTLSVPGDTATTTGTFNFMTGAVGGTYVDPGAVPSSGTFAGGRR